MQRYTLTTPLLTKDEEIEIYKAIEVAKNNIANIKSVQIISNAKNKMITSNIRLVVWKAKAYKDRGIDFDDLVQEGMKGLLKAIYKFDYKKDYRFSTYATWWIREAISSAVKNQTRTIKIPTNLIDIISDINKIQNQYQQLENKILSIEELVALTKHPKNMIQNALNVMREPVSYQALEEHKLDSMVTDKGINNPIYQVIEDEKHNQILNVMQELDELEQQVINMLFGITSEDERNISEISKILNLSTQQIRRIEKQAIKKLKQSEILNTII